MILPYMLQCLFNSLVWSRKLQLVLTTRFLSLSWYQFQLTETKKNDIRIDLISRELKFLCTMFYNISNIGLVTNLSSALQIVIQIGDELDGMVVIRSGDNRQGVCPLKFLQEVWQRHLLDKIQFEGCTYYPPRQPNALESLRSQLTNTFDNNVQTKAELLINKMYCQAECHSSSIPAGRSKLASYPPARCDQYKTAPDVVRSSISSDVIYSVDHTYSEKQGSRVENLNIFRMNDPTTPDVLWFIENTVDVDNQKILRRRSLARNLIPISSSTRPLGLPSTCSPSIYQRKLSRFRYRNIKNITSLSRPLLIGWEQSKEC